MNGRFRKVRRQKFVPQFIRDLLADQQFHDQNPCIEKIMKKPYTSSQNLSKQMSRHNWGYLRCLQEKRINGNQSNEKKLSYLKSKMFHEPNLLAMSEQDLDCMWKQQKLNNSLALKCDTKTTSDQKNQSNRPNIMEQQESPKKAVPTYTLSRCRKK